jgi:glycerophosphoryl diester phosphodiesterase
MKRKLLVAGFCLLVFSGFGKTFVIAHRGYWRHEGAAQNSIASLAYAQKLGVYGSELDIHLTSDGVLVVNHDDSIQGFNISSTPFSTLHRLKLSNGEPLPSFDEYLKQAGRNLHTKLIVEIKAKKDSLLELRTTQMAVEQIRKAGMEPHVVYISFSLNVCKELVRLAPGVPVSYLSGKEKALTPMQLKQLGISGLDYHYSVLLNNRQWFAEAKTLGITVNAWTVNDLDVMAQLIGLGADFVTTDDPVRAIALVSE